MKEIHWMGLLSARSIVDTCKVLNCINSIQIACWLPTLNGIPGFKGLAPEAVEMDAKSVSYKNFIFSDHRLASALQLPQDELDRAGHQEVHTQ